MHGGVVCLGLVDAGPRYSCKPYINPRRALPQRRMLIIQGCIVSLRLVCCMRSAWEVICVMPHMLALICSCALGRGEERMPGESGTLCLVWTAAPHVPVLVAYLLALPSQWNSFQGEEKNIHRGYLGLVPFPSHSPRFSFRQAATDAHPALDPHAPGF